MSHEVVVVGGGIGGLTTAALLAARGVDVCLIEKESRAGGCASSFEKFGYQFEPGMGLYTSWQPGEVHDLIFSELPVSAPETRKVTPPYVVRVPDGTQITIPEALIDLEENLRVNFPECAEAAIGFYRGLELVQSTAHTAPTLESHLANTSSRFRRFIDAQLQVFAQGDSETCSYSDAINSLKQIGRAAYSIRGGASALADALVESIRKSGGSVRTDTTVLRLAYDSRGNARGVDLLTGETVEATRAIVSNLTVWDTYGKLIGTSKTPVEIRSQLRGVEGWGAYLIFLAMEEKTAARLPADHILALTDWQEGQTYDPELGQFMFAAAPAWDPRAPEGMRAVTVSFVTEASQWFAFHQDESELEAQDQAALEACWARIHTAIPELGSGIEVIDTMTPRDFYQNTRRKLGMVGGISKGTSETFNHRTVLPNLFMVGDTVALGAGIAAVAQSALLVANEIAPPIKS
jgi:phytoene dehydrogenase-like protein